MAWRWKMRMIQHGVTLTRWPKSGQAWLWRPARCSTGWFPKDAARPAMTQQSWPASTAACFAPPLAVVLQLMPPVLQCNG